MKPKISVPVVYFGFHHGKYDKELRECIFEFFGNGGKFDFDDSDTYKHVEEELTDDSSYLVMIYNIQEVKINFELHQEPDNIMSKFGLKTLNPSDFIGEVRSTEILDTR